jgi:hypothetical protein
LRRPLESAQFVSLAVGQQARAAGIAQSMGSKGDCFDNAVAESFFATLKKELIHGRSWPSKAELRTEVFEYIEVFFNRRRRHSTLGMLSPATFEIRHDQQPEKIDSAVTIAAEKPRVHRTGGTPRQATERMIALNQAWEILRSPQMRAAYDWLAEQDDEGVAA